MRELTKLGHQVLLDRYCQNNERPQDVFARVAKACSSDEVHEKRLLRYMQNHWFMPSTPILANAGTDRGLPISCYLNTVEDSMEGIDETWSENVWLGCRGGGIGTNWSNVRAIGEQIAGRGRTSGVIPFLRVMDSQTLAVSQGSLRRGAAAVYLDISHPEIEEFLAIRKPSGDFNRKSLNLHHGITISDEFMESVRFGTAWDLVSPRDGSVRKQVNARTLWAQILETRIQTGEPYLLFSDNVRRGRSDIYQARGAEVTQSNLCSEIMLETTPERTAVCCLSSLNVEYFDEWCDDRDFIPDVVEMLDNVLEIFIANATGKRGFTRAVVSATQERSIGLGVMGFHSYLQSRNLSFMSPMAKGLNMKIFRHIQEQSDATNLQLGVRRGPCPDARANHLPHRFSNVRAVAPTASISLIAGQCSPGIEPWNTNYHIQKTLSGSHAIRNKYLEKLIDERDWATVLQDRGSVQNVSSLCDQTKEVFATSWEIDQRWVIEHAADRTPLIDQGQSVNLFLPANVDIYDLHMLHFSAWEKGLKSLYYLRSQSLQNAAVPKGKYEECLACQ